MILVLLVHNLVGTENLQGVRQETKLAVWPRSIITSVAGSVPQQGGCAGLRGDSSALVRGNAAADVPEEAHQSLVSGNAAEANNDGG